MPSDEGLAAAVEETGVDETAEVGEPISPTLLETPAKLVPLSEIEQRRIMTKLEAIFSQAVIEAPTEETWMKICILIQNVSEQDIYLEKNLLPYLIAKLKLWQNEEFVKANSLPFPPSWCDFISDKFPTGRNVKLPVKNETIATPEDIKKAEIANLIALQRAKAIADLKDHPDEKSSPDNRYVSLKEPWSRILREGLGKAICHSAFVIIEGEKVKLADLSDEQIQALFSYN